MTVDRKRVLGLALDKLLEEKKRIDDEIADVRAQMRGSSNSGKVKRKKSQRVKKKTKKKTSKKKASKKSQYAKTAQTMKEHWKRARAAGFNNLRDYKASLEG